MKRRIKYFFHIVAIFLVFPSILMVRLECFFSDRESIFIFWSHFFAFSPGIPGLFLRRAFYCSVLDRCSRDVHIGFGTLFSHRTVVIDENVYIGPYTLIGSVCIGKECFIGSRVSLLSGKNQHRRVGGRWSASTASGFMQISVGDYVWIGEGAIVMADVEDGSLVAAGAVVVDRVGANNVVAGNPAKTVKIME